MNIVKSIPPVHIHLEPVEVQPRRSSFDLNAISSMLTRSKSRLNSNVMDVPTAGLDGQRSTRFSSLSSSYAQFLKQRDTDKNKKTLSQEDHRLLLSSSEWVEDIKDSDPYVSILSRLG
ncbi:unnamed protein product, partial [Rotaria magnacalcarata]